MEDCEIVIAKFFQGGIKPKNPTYGTVWFNDYEGTVSIYLKNKWFECLTFENTGYTNSQKTEIKERAEKEKSELEKYKNFMKNFKELLENID